MNKRGKRVICVSEIFLLVSVSFAISFLMGENLVEGQSRNLLPESGLPPATKPPTRTATEWDPSRGDYTQDSTLQTGSGSASAAAAAQAAETFEAGSTITQGAYTGGTIQAAEGAKVISGAIPQGGWTAAEGSKVVVAVNDAGNTVVTAGGKTTILEGQGYLTAGADVVGTETSYSAKMGLFDIPMGSGTGAFFGAHLLEGVVWGGIVA